MFRLCGKCLLIALIALSCCVAWAEEPDREKVLMIAAAGRLLDDVGTLFGPGEPQPADDARWLRSQAESWVPSRRDEGKALRESLELMREALHRPPRKGRRLNRFKRAIAEDLKDKRDHCKLFGLSAEQKTEVKTLRNGRDEIKGLEVWYLEKFLMIDPAAKPHRFRGFSSPVQQDIAPGRYLFWASDPTSGRAAEKLEQRVGASGGVEKIEVLAP